MERGKEILHQPLHPPNSEQRYASPKPNNGDPAPPSSSPMADNSISNADILTREEVLRRRSRRLKRLKRIYSEQYWALAEEIRVKHRDFYWQFGKSPLEDEDDALELGFRERERGRGRRGEEEVQVFRLQVDGDAADGVTSTS